MNVEIIKNKSGEPIYPLSHADSTLYDSTTSQTVKSKIDSMCSDLSIASSSASTTITDSADGNIRDFVAYGKSSQGENPTPTSPQDILAWDGNITTKNEDESKTSTADLGINLYGIKVASGGNYTDASGQMWLCDVLDYSKGTITRNVKVENLDSSLNWRKSTGTIGSYYITNWCADRGLEVNDTSSMLTHFKVVKRSEFVYGTVFVNPALNIFIGEETCPTVDDWKTWLDNNELYIAYKLAESVVEELTDEQISALRNLQTYSDGTTIEYGTLNPFATIDYWRNNINGQAVADVDAKINKLFALLNPATTSEPAPLSDDPTE